MSVYGQDWSSYQSASPDTSGLAFAFIKVTQGLSYTNPSWVSQRAAARKAGLVVGFYHYPNIANSPAAEADHFLSQINLVAGDILCLDWEWYGQNVTNAQARSYKDAWLAYVKAKVPGHKIGIYSDTGNWKNVDTNSNCGDFLWIADYTTPGQPRISHPWTFHQYTSSPLDKDIANFATAADLKAWAGAATPAPKPSPAPTPTPATPQWKKLLDHVMAVPEGVYEHWQPSGGWDNHTIWGVEYGEDGVPYCVIGLWDEYHECALDKAVPKTDNVNDFRNWAQQNGEWTEWPSVCAWADFGDGAHAEMVIGFTATEVITKGWNSIQTGSKDSGQGNGVWVHRNPRSVPTGYLAPRFPDNACPPTANPHDPRGGAAQTEYIPEDPMPTAQEIAQAVWEYVVDDATQAGNNPIPVKTQLWDATMAAARGNDTVTALTAQLGAMSAAITALTKSGGITAEQVQAAAAAGAKAALEELAAAIGKAGA